MPMKARAYRRREFKPVIINISQPNVAQSSFLNQRWDAMLRNMTNRAEFEVRPAVPDDRTDLLRLSTRLTIGVAPWRDRRKVAAAVRGWITSSLASAGLEGHAVFVALLGGQVAGLVSLAEREHFTREMDPCIGELAVAATLEGRGCGRALLAAAEVLAAGRGLAHITLETGADNHRARDFYERAGFQAEDIRFTKPVQARR